MAHIFLSYASEDRDRAREVAGDLEAIGWKVWWDHRLQAGKTFAGVIESEIKQAGCVLVLWSKASIVSRWVRDEANEGLARNVLVPARIDAVEPPMGFRSIHAADLIDYHGDDKAPGFQQLVADLTQLLGPPARTASWRVPPRSEPVADRRKWLRAPWSIAAIAAIVALGAWGVVRYVGDFERRTTELDARQKAFEAERRRADEDAAKRQAELDAKDRAAAEKEKARAAEAAAAAEAARRAEAEKQRVADAEKQRIADAERQRAAEAEKRRVAESEAARKAEGERARGAAAARQAEEERQRSAAAKRPPPSPAEGVILAPDTPAAKAPTPAVVERPPAEAPRAAGSPLLPSPGDTWSYRYVDGFRRGEVARLTYRVDAVGDAGVGETLRVSNRPDYASSITVARVPRFSGHSGLDYAPPDLAPYLQAYYKLEEDARLPAIQRVFTSDATVRMQMRIAGRERVTVPAGTFDAIKVVVEGRGETFINRVPMHSIVTIWYAPAAKRFVKFDARTYERTLPQELSTFELVDFKLAR
jgi:hypothetical protein